MSENENIYAYIRVSTKEQNEARQVIRMENLGISKKNIIIEKESGKSQIRVKYQKLVKQLRKGDILYIENIDRLSRDYDGILSQWHMLTQQKGVTIRLLDTPMLDTDQRGYDLLSRFICDIVLHIQAFQAAYEWEKLKARQAQGIAVARASGKPLGRSKSPITENEINTVEQYKNGDISLTMALQLLNIKKSAFYRLCSIISKETK